MPFDIWVCYVNGIPILLVIIMQPCNNSSETVELRVFLELLLRHAAAAAAAASGLHQGM
jgi:hypothetical protein